MLDLCSLVSSQRLWLSRSFVNGQPAMTTKVVGVCLEIGAREFVAIKGRGSRPLAALRSGRLATPRFTSPFSAGRSVAWRADALFQEPGAWMLPALGIHPRASRRHLWRETPLEAGSAGDAQSAHWAHCAGSGLAFARRVETLRHSRGRERLASTPLIQRGLARTKCTLRRTRGAGLCAAGADASLAQSLRDAWAPRTPSCVFQTALWSRVLKHIQAMPARHCLDRNGSGFVGEIPSTWAAWAAHPATETSVGLIT